MRLAIIILYCLFTFASCKDKKTIAAELFDHCEGDSCTQELENVIDFKWDKVYIFSQAASLEEIDSTLGFHFEEWQDLGEKIIFTSGNSVTYHENHFHFPEKLENGTTFFKINTTSYIGEYPTATFSISKVNHKSGKYYYEITPLR